MSILTTLSLLLLLTFATAQVAPRPTIYRFRRTSLEENTFINNGTIGGLRRLQRRIIDSGSCNANICFALDGSGSISPFEYRLQIQFAQLISALISVDSDAGYSAVQYGLRNIEISTLTDDIDAFVEALTVSELAGAERTFLAAGIGFCIQELRSGATEDGELVDVTPTVRPELPPKIIVLGDGRSNFGISPVPIASLFGTFFETAEICAIGIGFPDVRTLRDIVGEDRSNVFVIQRYAQLPTVLESIVEAICEL